jgi:hypothetical protein
MESSSQFYCHVCGLERGDVAPWGPDGLCPTYEICECCGVEYGYEDCLPSGVVAARERWAAAGFQWRTPKLRPPAWNAAEQLNRLPLELPEGIRRNAR